MKSLALFGLLALPTPAMAQYFTPTSMQQWSYYTLGVGNPQACEGLWDIDEQLSLDVAPFTVQWERNFRCLGIRGSVRAWQTSSFNETEMSCNMRSICDVSAEQIVPLGWSDVSSTNWYESWFDVPNRVRVRVRASAQLDFDAVIEPGHYDDAHIWITFPGGLISVDTWDAGNPREFDEELTLAPGQRYAFWMYIYDAILQQDASVQTGAEHLDARASFRMDVIPCPGDIDYDNAVSLSDLNVLLAHLGGLGARAEGDLDGDGLVDFTDLTQMLSLFGSTCTW